MGSPAPQAVKPSDYQPLIESQAAYNRGNVYTPYGSLEYTDPVYETPKVQKRSNGKGGGGVAGAVLGPNAKSTRRLVSRGSQRFNLDPSLTDTSALEQAMYDKQMRLLQPQYDLQEQKLTQSLANRGLPSGGEAYGDEVSLFRQNRDESMQNLANQSVMAGEGVRGQRIGQAMSMLGFKPTPVDITGPAQMMQSINNSQAQSSANAKGGASSLGSSLIMASMLCAKELKEHYEETGPVLDKLAALPVERWNYKGETAKHIGPYAEDFKELFGVGDGKTIHMVDAFGVMLASIKELTARVRELEV